ncbi:hypothetical protein AM587_10006549 [Phytophthora nicotianae]|uniref:Uncharacterized protein n=1 Tax=Phytophthora nicotianae TaxID=4792 RepID=A0A0W8DJ22_PHYNI|nr:hypothetical protein AM587_10002794 [Phytophthora nicotianae]KUF96375.1 hypothetical protein AM587_10006549 [Phytophthora nicotianae]
MAFRCVGSPLDEMRRLEKLRELDPESAANLVANGKLLVDFVRDGNLRALQCAAEYLEEGQMLIFYTVRMFREACATRRLDILRFMLLNGFDLQQSYMRDVLHSIIDNIDSPQSADAVQPLIRFLLDAGVDVNWQRTSDLYTTLHVACCKNLYPIAYLLVLFGADVNAIAAVPRSKLLNDNYRDENQEQDSNPYEERVQDELSSNQIHDDLAVETAPKTKRKNRPRTAIGKGSKDNKKSVEPPSPPRPEVEPTPKLVQVEVISEPDRKYPPAVPKADDPTFYMLELRLDHPEPLANWRFQASFTDTSVDPSKTVILDDLMADGENCLLFDDLRLPPGSTPSRFFNPFLYFPGLTRPSDLYGHVLRIIVTSLRPVTRTVINTSVQFTYSPDEAVVKPPVQSIRQRSENVATQDVRVLPRRNRSASSASRRGVKVSKVQKKKTPRLLQNNNHESSTSSLAMDQCNPWSSSEQNDTDADDHQAYTLGQMFTLYLDEPRPPSPTTPTRKDPIPENLTRSPQTPIATIDKKKMQLQSLRASMRVC